jgi:hypothetical protein
MDQDVRHVKGGADVARQDMAATDNAISQDLSAF